MKATRRAPRALGPDAQGRLAPCPASPNCVCSDVGGAAHAIAPLRISGDPDAAWKALVAYLESTPGLTIVRHEPGYLHVEARTRWLRFVDDVEFHLRAERGEIAMRSASRVGYSDLGTNRRRLEALRRALEDRL